MYQRKGKEHIRYIRDMAKKSYEDNKELVPFDACLVDALKRHRSHITKIADAHKHYYESRRNNFSALND